MVEQSNQEEKIGCLHRMKNCLQSGIKKAARKVAKGVCAHPKKTIGIYIICLLISACGLFRLESLKNNDIADLFTPSHSESHNEADIYNEYFKPSSDSFQIIAVPSVEGRTFNTNGWLELIDMEKKLNDIRVDGVGADDFCTKMADGSCLHLSPFLYFDWNKEEIKMTSDKIRRICTHEKNYLPLYLIFGQTGNVNTTNCQEEDGLSTATALSIYYGFSFENYNASTIHKWIREAENIVKDYQKSSRYWNVDFMSGYGLSNEVERGTLQTLTKLGVSIVLVICLLIFAFHEDSYMLSTALAFESMISVLLACGMGLGISLLVGLPWTTITPVIVFLAIGLGIDNMVLLTILFYRSDKNKEINKRMMDAAGEAALFNTLSTLTTVLAFIMGINSSFKGIMTFCISSAIVMTCVFMTTFTLFVALLYLNMRHYEKRRKTYHKTHHHQVVEDGQDNSFITRFYRNIVSKIFVSTPARIIVLILFAAMLGFSGYEISIIQQGIVPEDAVPEDSFVTAYLNTARVHFKEKIAELDVTFYNTTLNRDTRRAIIADMIDDMKTVPYILPQYENPWDLFDAYLVENNIEPSAASGVAFYIHLLQCVQQKPRIAEYLSLDLDHFDLPAAKVKFAIDPVAVSELERGQDTLLGAREVIDKYMSKYGMYIKASSYSSMYPYYEMVGITFRETVINLITSAVAVMIVLFLLLPPGPSFIAVINVLLADVCILGWVPFTGLNLNAITSTCMVMSVGIAVDFSAHITHAFVETDSTGMTGGERAAAAVTKMGRSLTSSALTTFLSVFMLCTVTVPSNRMFFTMMSGVVLFGMLFGILLLPTILSFFNPKYVKPVKLSSPTTPLPANVRAEILEKSRNQGIRRHHRKHRKGKKNEEEEKPIAEVIEESVSEGEVTPEQIEAIPKVEAIDDSSDDGTFADVLSDETESTIRLPQEIELPVIQSNHVPTPTNLSKPQPNVTETKPSSVSTPSTAGTGVKKFHRPRDIQKEEIKKGDVVVEQKPNEPEAIDEEVSSEAEVVEQEAPGLLASVWSYISGSTANTQ